MNTWFTHHVSCKNRKILIFRGQAEITLAALDHHAVESMKGIISSAPANWFQGSLHTYTQADSTCFQAMPNPLSSICIPFLLGSF